MDPITGTIVSMLVKEGLGLLAGLVTAGGKKAIEKIEEKTGIDIKNIADPETATELSPAQFTILKKFETEEALNLVKVVASADVEKAPGIIMAAIAQELPEMFLFLIGLVLVATFAIWGTSETAGNLASAWLGAFAMYVKGK